MPLDARGVRRRLRAGLARCARRAAAGRAWRADRRLGRAGVLRSLRRAAARGDGRRARPARPLHRAGRRRGRGRGARAARRRATPCYFPFDGARTAASRSSASGAPPGWAGPGRSGCRFTRRSGLVGLPRARRRRSPAAAARRRSATAAPAATRPASPRARPAPSRAPASPSPPVTRAASTAEPCRLSCAARIACVRGPEHRYTDAQLAFHMAASMPKRLPLA